MAKYLRHQKTGRLMGYTDALWERHGVTSPDSSNPFLVIVNMSEKQAAKISQRQKLKGETIHDLIPQCSSRQELEEIATRYGIAVDPEVMEEYSLTRLKQEVLDAWLKANPDEAPPPLATVTDKDKTRDPDPAGDPPDPDADGESVADLQAERLEQQTAESEDEEAALDAEGDEVLPGMDVEVEVDGEARDGVVQAAYDETCEVKLEDGSVHSVDIDGVTIVDFDDEEDTEDIEDIDELDALRVHELQAVAKDRGLKGYSKLSRPDLLALLRG